MSTPPALEIIDLSVRYGGVRAVDDFNAAIEPGQVLGLIGPNGAGKTSMIDGITGYTPIASGRVVLAGRDVTRMAPHQLARAGLVRTFQQLELFTDLTVRENISLAAQATRRAALDVVDDRIDLFGLGGYADVPVSSLPQGLRRMVALTRAAITRPIALLLDEPAAGLDSDESDRLHERVRALAAEGIGILLVEHDMALVMKTCDHLVVVEFGRTIATGTPESIRQDARVIEAYLGVGEVAEHA